MESVILRYITILECPSCQRKLGECSSLRDCLAKMAENRSRSCLIPRCPLCERCETIDSQLECYDSFVAILQSYGSLPIEVSQHLGISERLGSSFNWYNSKSGIVFLRSRNSVVANGTTNGSFSATSTDQVAEPASSTCVENRQAECAFAIIPAAEPECLPASISGQAEPTDCAGCSPEIVQGEAAAEELASSSSRPAGSSLQQETGESSIRSYRRERRLRSRRFTITLPKAVVGRSRVVNAELQENSRNNEATRDEEHVPWTGSATLTEDRQRYVKFGKLVACLAKVYGDDDYAQLGEAVTVLANATMK